MNVAVIVATCGDPAWANMAAARAIPSVADQLPCPGASFSTHHYPDLTVAEARNRAAAQHGTTHDWLCFLDADDELEPGYLDAMNRANDGFVYPPVTAQFTTSAPPLLVPKVRRIPAGFLAGPPESPRFPAGIPNQGRWPRTNECVIGTLVHRDLFERVGGFREWPLYEDWDLWLRCHDAGAQLVYTDAVYREHVSEGGRNTNPGEAQTVYDAIWDDHLARTT